MTLTELVSITPEQLNTKLALIPLLPLVGAIINGFFGRRFGHERAAFIGTASVLGSFLVSSIIFANLLTNPAVAEYHQDIFTWFETGRLSVKLGFTADHLSGILLMVITGIGSLIHLYSAAYMEKDEHSWRYFAYLNLFVASMLLLVLGDNLATLFVGWEGVGLCSYLLIGFWFTDLAKASAGRKAFIVNRIGDFGFLIGMFTLFALFGTLNISDLQKKAKGIETGNEDKFSQFNAPIYDTPYNTFVPTWVQERTNFLKTMPRPRAPVAADFETPPVGQSKPYTYHFIIGLALLFLFVGATGKSAQIPLYIWLPDAMAGPTPVSALIHAATMVTAGVYMMGRLSFLYVNVPEVLAVAAVIGVLTSLFAALMAFAQNDIKKVLAYSTVSQLGYMFVGVGSGAFFAGTYHLVTHAFFKACLFLGAGAVIHGVHDEQDIRKMGGLKKYMPHTRWTFLIATITISGVLPFSGFFSKDEILVQAKNSSVLAFFAPWLPIAVYVLGSITALCTSFYMFRLYFLTFEGEYRGTAHPHESPPEMTVPLWILAILSIAAAALGIPGHNGFEEFTKEVFSPVWSPNAAESVISLWPFGVAAGLAWLGFLAARGWYGKGLPAEGDPLETKTGWFYNLSANTFYVDEIYNALIVRPLWASARGLHRFFDAFIIDKILVNGVAWFTSLVARLVSPFENGDLSRYAALTALAVVGLIVWAVV
jgi:NADH-quinone oxidoreductase subunit L